MLISTFRDPIYAVRFYVLHGCDEKQFTKFLKSKGCTDPNIIPNYSKNDASTTEVISTDEDFIVFWFSESIKVPSGKAIRLIAHEANHAIGYIYKQCGVNFDYDNDEPTSYYLGWLCQKIYESFEKIQSG